MNERSNGLAPSRRPRALLKTKGKILPDIYKNEDDISANQIKDALPTWILKLRSDTAFSSTCRNSASIYSNRSSSSYGTTRRNCSRWDYGSVHSFEAMFRQLQIRLSGVLIVNMKALHLRYERLTEMPSN